MVPTLTCGLVRSNFPFAIFPTPKNIYLKTTGSRRNQNRTHLQMVPMAGIGPATSPLPRECSTTELHGHAVQATHGAGEGNRTLVVSLEGFCSTIELHPPATDLLPNRYIGHAVKSSFLSAIQNAPKKTTTSFGGGGRIRTFEG